MDAAAKIEFKIGDCLDILPTLAENSIDSCVTDPPYHLTSIVKRFGGSGAYGGGFKPEGNGTGAALARMSRGFMGKQWDGGDVAFNPDTWAKVYRVLKPGAHLLAFGGTRTYHRMACAIEDAGFEIRDCIQWLYGSGFPKSHDVSKGVDRAAGAEREVIGSKKWTPGKMYERAGQEEQGYRPAGDSYPSESLGKIYTAPATDAARQWEGWGTALKPACEMIVLARKPLSEKTVAANVLKWGTGAINVDGCRVEAGNDHIANCARTFQSGIWKTSGMAATEITTEAHVNGRWPANVIHDGSGEVVAGFPDSGNGSFSFSGQRAERQNPVYGVPNTTRHAPDNFGDSGSAARFFYQVKQDEPCEQNASNAEKCLLRCHRQNDDIAPLIAPTQDELKIAQNVKSAASLCNLCAIVIAQNLVALRHGQNPALDQFKDIIGERNARILSRCLALYVAGREGIDIILTTPNLKQLFGSVFHAIATSTEESDYDHKTAPEKSRRFWYTSKADQDDRIGSKHPTVKPLDLMQYLVRLVTPKGGTVLDPFAGTGTTGEAAFREGMRALLIEREAEYTKDIRRRIALCMAGPVERANASMKAKQDGKPRDDGPLFNPGAWDDMWSRPFDRPDLV